MSKDKKIKVGLAGFGAAAKYMHAPFLITNGNYEVVAVLERHKNESQQLFPGAKIARSIEDLLAIDEIELVIITTPNDTHLPYAMQALNAGKHAVLEKPFTITSNDALQLLETAKQPGKILSVFHNRRYVADFLTIKEILNKKLLGDVHEFEGHYNRYRPEAKPNAWREEAKPGSGILYDLGPHLIDQALVLFGLPETITADIRLQRPHARADDYFDIRLDYGFTRVILKAGMLVREPGPRYQIHGTKGSYLKYGEDPQEVLLRAGVLPTAADWGLEKEEIYGLLHTEIDGKVVKEKYVSQRGNYGYYYKNLYNTIVDKAPLREKPEHGYNTIKLIELAIESNSEKATVKCEELIDIDYPQD
jgi:predicted dehydrogenase